MNHSLRLAIGSLFALASFSSTAAGPASANTGGININPGSGVSPKTPATSTLSSIAIDPANPIVGAANKIIVKGNGNVAGCKYKLEISRCGASPNIIEKSFAGQAESLHLFAYGASGGTVGAYSIKVSAVSGCAGSVVKEGVVTIAKAGDTPKAAAEACAAQNPPGGDAPPQQTAQLTSATLSKASITAYDSVNLVLGGTGVVVNGCQGEIDWGDGSPKFDNSFTDANKNWRTLVKTYVKVGTFTIVAKPKNFANVPCTTNTADGTVKTTIVVAPPPPPLPSVISKFFQHAAVSGNTQKFSVKWEPLPPVPGVTYLNKPALCSLKVDWGDGTTMPAVVGAVQPGFDADHNFPGPGSYTAKIIPVQNDLSACTVSAPQVVVTIQ